MPPDLPTSNRFSSRRAFAAKQLEFNARLNIEVRIWIAGVLLVVGAIAYVSAQMRAAQVEDNALWGLLMMGTLLAPVFGGVILLDRYVTRNSPKCPNCNKTMLFNRREAPVLLTGRCPHCAACLFQGEAELIDPASGSTEGKLLLRDELQEARRAANRRAVKPMLKWASSGVVLLVSAGVINVVLGNWINQEFGEVWSPIIRCSLTFPGVIVGSWAMIVGTRASSGYARCPRCGDEISARGIATQTGYCSKCGQRAVQDPWPGMAASVTQAEEPAWSIEKYRSIAHRLNRHRNMSLVAGQVMFLLNLPVLILLEVIDRDGNVSGGMRNSLFVVGLILLPLVALACCATWARHRLHQLDCPHCRRTLASSYWLVISTRRCVHCGEVVLDRATEVART